MNLSLAKITYSIRRHVLSISLACSYVLYSSSSFAQVPAGTIAPNWEATDINGHVWSLDSLLDAGHSVIIQFFHAPYHQSWFYHETGILSNLHESFGPDGTDDLRVFLIAVDAPDFDMLSGTAPYATGDWISSTPFPIIANDPSIAGEYFDIVIDNVGGINIHSVFSICPDGTLTHCEDPQFGALMETAFVSCSNLISGSMGFAEELMVVKCADDVDLEWSFFNTSTDAIQSITALLVAADDPGISNEISFDTQIDPGTWGTIVLEGWDDSGSYLLDIQNIDGTLISSPDVATEVLPAELVSKFIQIEVLTDDWGHELSWELWTAEDSLITAIESNTLEDTTVYSWWVELDAEQCYRLSFHDDYGDGLYAAPWGGNNGFIKVTSHEFMYDAASTMISQPLNYLGDYAFSDLNLGLSASITNPVTGCIDDSACNYVENAQYDDGTCVFPACSDPEACNYNPTSACEGECIYSGELNCGLGTYWDVTLSVCLPIASCPEDINASGNVGISDLLLLLAVFGEECTVTLGCTLPEACNFNPSATENDGSCLYFDVCGVCGGEGVPDGYCDCDGATPEPGFDCNGECLVDVDGDGVCDDGEISGCTISIACNFNPFATEDDNSCEFYCPGCTNPDACNFDPNAQQSDNSCQFPQDIWGTEFVDCDGVCILDADGDGICDEAELAGCPDEEACNYLEGATDVSPCDYQSCAGCTYVFACNYDPSYTITDIASCEFGTCAGCTDPQACNFNPTVSEDDGSCIADTDGDGICDPDEVLGCTLPNAENFDSNATDNDGSCVLVGCMDSVACNYDDGATISETDLCVFPNWGQIAPQLSEVEVNALKVSSSGNSVVIGSTSLSPTGGVLCLNFNGETWELQGDTILGITGIIGNEIAISASGQRIFVSDPNYTHPVSGNNFGRVRCYDWNGESWQQLGNSLIGGGVNHYFGEKMECTADGETLIVSTRMGYAQVFKLLNFQWQLIDELPGLNPAHNTYARCTISPNGTWAAVAGNSVVSIYKKYEQFELDTTISPGLYFGRYQLALNDVPTLVSGIYATGLQAFELNDDEQWVSKGLPIAVSGTNLPLDVSNDGNRVVGTTPSSIQIFHWTGGENPYWVLESEIQITQNFPSFVGVNELLDLNDSLSRIGCMQHLYGSFGCD